MHFDRDQDLAVFLTDERSAHESSPSSLGRTESSACGHRGLPPRVLRELRTSPTAGPGSRKELGVWRIPMPWSELRMRNEAHRLRSHQPSHRR